MLYGLKHYRSHTSMGIFLVAHLSPHHVEDWVVPALTPAPGQLMAQGIQGLELGESQVCSSTTKSDVYHLQLPFHRMIHAGRMI